MFETLTRLADEAWRVALAAEAGAARRRDEAETELREACNRARIILDESEVRAEAIRREAEPDASRVRADAEELRVAAARDRHSVLRSSEEAESVLASAVERAEQVKLDAEADRERTIAEARSEADRIREIRNELRREVLALRTALDALARGFDRFLTAPGDSAAGLRPGENGR